MADHRRGPSHQAPQAAMRMRSAITEKAAVGLEDNEFSTSVSVHFVVSIQPFHSNQLPRKPIRCKDCMDKVKDGKATKEELAAEREVLTKHVRTFELAGIKLFIARCL